MKRRLSTFNWLVDALAINAAYVVFFYVRVTSGVVDVVIEPEFWFPMLVLWVFWSAAFFLGGLYARWEYRSRVDEVFSIIKSTSIGTLLLFFLIVMDDLSTGSPSTSRLLIAGYWMVLTLSVIVGRMLFRYIQRRLLLAGVGLRRTVVVGWSRRAFDLCDMVHKFPSLGYQLAGFVTPGPLEAGTVAAEHETYRGLPILGGMDKLEAVLKEHEIEEILVGLESREHDQLLAVLRACNGRDVGVKILADMYDIVTGQARVASIFGVPLLDIQPQIMQPWEEAAKRMLDAAVALTVLVFGSPVWLLIAIAVKLDSSGPALYRQERVGRNGKTFGIIKYRSMSVDAEKSSGPVWAGKNDPRVTRMGRLLRKMHVDEVPQFWNVLVGDMSLVGPRPERPHFVEALSKEIPLYRRRLKVRPGITGWAQVKHKYDETIDDVRIKVKYDLFYIENASWRFDMKILLNTLYVMLMRKGHS